MKQNSLDEQIELVSRKFLEIPEEKEILIVSHFDTDGITSATIMTKTLKRLDRRFSVKIVKSLDEKFVKALPKDKIILFLDLASGSLNYFEEFQKENIFIIDHHEIAQEIPEGINIVNSELHEKQKISASSLTYLFCRKINSKTKKLAKLAILGMVGDILEKEVDKLNNGILDDGEIKRKRGLMIYPSTRPLNRTLEYCSSPYIPGVTGNIKGVLEILRETGLAPEKGKYKSLIELNDEEMEKLTTAIMLRNPKTKNREIIGEIFLLKMFNKLEDARELSAMINACSRLGHPEIAIQFCMESEKAKKKAEAIHVRYKQHLISGLKCVAELEKIQGKDFVIINAENKIKDTIIGTVTTILQNSALYEEGTILVSLADNDNHIKISARVVGNNGKNAREILARVVDKIGGEVGGHSAAAGANILKEKQQEFINSLKKELEIEVVKV
jgi:single-stranded-DNA-specific exonuclease